MSSGTRVNMSSTRAALPAAAEALEGGGTGGPTMKLSDRQKNLDMLYRYFRCANYDGRKTDWDGRAELGKIEHDLVATGVSMSNGFYDAGQTGDVPLKFRKPSAPFYLARVIVKRFTSLLFSQRRHPKIHCDDPRTEDWLNGFAEATRLWSHMSFARDYGGAMGSTCVGFKIIDSKPIIEVHDPRWCHPEFNDRDEMTVSRLEKRYQFMEEVLDQWTGERLECWFWYRRVLDVECDTVWPRVAVQDDEEPDWDKEDNVSVPHNFGFCPVVWVQNVPISDAVDGDPDCLGIYDTIEQIDRLWAQASRGTIASCDPTLTIASDAEFREIRKGAGNALQVEKGGQIQYLELDGTGAEAACKLAGLLEDRAAMVARCELKTNFDGPARTEEEVEKNYSNMVEQADELREQYGERCVKKLLSMVLLVAKKVNTTSIDFDTNPEVPTLVRSVIRLPKKRVETPDGKIIWKERELGKGEQIELTWPEYFQPSIESIAAAVNAAGAAKQFTLISKETATKFIAPHFQIEDIKGEVTKADEEAQAEQDAMLLASSTMVGAGAPGSVTPLPGAAKAPGASGAPGAEKKSIYG